MSVVVVTTISCDAAILRCSSCQAEAAIPSASLVVSGNSCRACGGEMLLDRSCDAGFALHKDGLLIRCIAENKDSWRCENREGRDFCPDHANLAEPSHVERPSRPHAPHITL